MNEINLQINSLQELQLAAQQLISFFEDYKIILFEGEIGVGKTTLIKQICKTLGSKDDLNSPTYSIVNEYDLPTGKIYHFDLYRINQLEELFDLGIDEYLNSGQFCFIEWPQKLIDVIDSKYISIQLKSEKNIRYIRAYQISA